MSETRDNDFNMPDAEISATGLSSTLAAIWAALNMDAALSIPSIFEEAALESMATWFMYGVIVYGWITILIVALAIVVLIGALLWGLAGKTT